MIKTILHPGNGINFPLKGEYVKIHLLIMDNNKQIIFDSKLYPREMEIRYMSEESNLNEEIEELIGEMSLYERCCLEKTSEKIIYEIEIFGISTIPNFCIPN